MRARLFSERVLVQALSVLTGAFFAISAGALIIQPATSPWPIGIVGLFTRGHDFSTELEYRGETRAGRRVVLNQRDFGLRRLQLRAWTFRNIMSESNRRRRRNLGRLASIWNEAHREDPLVSLTVHIRRLPLSNDGEPTIRRVARWRADESG